MKVDHAYNQAPRGYGNRGFVVNNPIIQFFAELQ